MPAPNYNFQIEKGSSFDINFQYNDAAGNPIDLTNACVILQWISSDNSSTQIFNSNTSNQDGFSLTKNNLGQINFHLFSDTTKEYSFVSAVYDLDIIQEVDGRQENVRILTGTIGIIDRNCDVRSCDIASGSEAVEVTVTPTATDGASPTPTPSALPSEFEDLCLPADCTNLDVYSSVYTGDSILISDYAISSGTILIENTGAIENFEVAINGLRHNSPQDIVMVLSPPDTISNGSGILLSANSKIPSYVSGTSFSCMFSNKADFGTYLHNMSNGDLCNIFDKTDIIRFEGSALLSSFDHFIGESVDGPWTLYIQDTDVGVSGSIDSWKIVTTYPAPEEV